MRKHLLFSIVTFILFIATTKVAYCANAISYAGAPFAFTTGIAVNQPATFSGSTLSGTNPYSITSGSLPSGLTLNTVNGTISGTPTATFSGSVTISAAFKNGTSPNPASVAITITVNLNPKPVISYTSPQTYPVNVVITPLSPTNTGSAVINYSAATLPAGLSIDPVTGIISGTPTTIATATVYTITATNAAGSGTFNLTITVNPLAPNISYNPAAYTFGLLSFSSTSTPTNTGGAVTNPLTGWTSSPALPAGLAFSADTSGTITGTPTALSGTTTYNITATNAGGSSIPFLITISVISNYFDWTGAAGDNNWTTPGNWKFGSTVQTVNYPGKTATTDIVHIGVIAFSNGNITVPPTLSNPIASITFGDPSPGALAINLSIASGATLAVSGNVTLNDAKETVNLSGPGAFTIGGDYLTGKSAKLINSSCPITMSGNFTNSGTSNFGTALLTFNGSGSNTVLKSTGTQIFTNVLFTGSRVTLIQHFSGGKFAIAPTGVMTLSGSAHINVASGNITLLSDATGSATIAAIPSTCILNGSNVSVQRYIQGSTDLTKRGYRLLSSTVYTGNDGISNVSDLQYLQKSVHLSGPGYAANGFDVTSTANPSIYLFREDDPPPPTSGTIFTTGYNWKGIAKINSTPAYMLGTQFKTDQFNYLDTLTTLPVGNGILFFFRGDINQAVLPIPFPNSVTLTETGTLNTGTIAVRLWFSNPANNSLGNTFSYTDPTNPLYSSSTSLLKSGFALVGNPYPSTINWEKYNNPNALNAITGGGGMPAVIYEFNVASKQYGAYMPVQGADITSEFPAGSVSTNGATNLIASGEGFFVQASAVGQSLTFNEAAKVNTLPNAANLLNFMGKPKEFVAAPKALLDLKLVTDSVNYDEIVIRLSNNASTKYVVGEDAPDLDGSGALESLTSFSSDSARLAINTMPYPGKQPQVIRLGANAPASGTYNLTVAQLNNLPALYQAWLKDAFTGDSLQLKTNANYKFTIDKSNTATFGPNRFTVIIRQDTAFAYKLLSFTATKADHKKEVQLDWKTVNEQNYTNFTVERSTDDGQTFDVIGGLQGTGAGNYSLLDKKPNDGQNLYRLKQEDINNAITYSNVVDVEYADKFAKLHIFPNPATHTINLAIAGQGNDKGVYSIRFVNSSGIVVKQVDSSEPQWQGNVSYLQPGTYLVRVINTKTQNLVGENKFVKL